ncbi:MAG: hypothetical protein IJV09_02535 [Prevotella sp.]|nr:hypothetical protein [Prevotella sp.]
MTKLSHTANYVLSAHEGTMFFDRIYLNGELSTLLKVDGYNHCEIVQENVTGEDRLYMIFSRRENGNIEYSKSTVGAYIVDSEAVSRILEFWKQKPGEQYHLHFTRNTSRTGTTTCVQILKCVSHVEYVNSLELRAKARELTATDPNENTEQRRAYKGAARGCKPGYTRHTYVLSKKMIEQVKAVANFFNCSEASAVEQILQKGFDDIQKKHGPEALTYRTMKIFG